MSKKFFAFWRNFKPQYTGIHSVLGGEIVSLKRDNIVETKQYGPGYYFNAINILPLEEGRELYQKIKNLEGCYAVDRRELDEKYQNQVYKLLPWLKDDSK